MLEEVKSHLKGEENIMWQKRAVWGGEGEGSGCFTIYHNKCDLLHHLQ